MFEKLLVYTKVINEFKRQHGLVESGFPFDSFHAYYQYYGNLGMLGFFLKFVQQYKYLVTSVNKKIIVIKNGKILFEKEVAIDPYDIPSRLWYGILACCAHLNKSNEF